MLYVAMDNDYPALLLYYTANRRLLKHIRTSVDNYALLYDEHGIRRYSYITSSPKEINTSFASDVDVLEYLNIPTDVVNAYVDNLRK